MTRAFAALLALAACGEDEPVNVVIREVAVMPSERVTALDVLLQIDDTGHRPADVVRAMLPSLYVALAVNGAPSVRVGVVTSDLGTLGGPSIGSVGSGGCEGFADNGAFFGGGFLDAPTLEELEPRLQVGAHGCGFEQPLAATRIALGDGAFLRDDASLAVVVVAEEDDCSMTDGRLLRDDLGPLASFRCTQHGVVCDEPIEAVGAKTNCRPARDSIYVEDPRVTSDFLLATRAPGRVVFGVVAGPREPVDVALVASGNAPPVPNLSPSCGASSDPADPAVRLASVVDDFESRGVLTSLCEPPAASATRLALAIRRSLGIGCLDDAVVADRCEAVEIDEDGTARPLSRCPGDSTCFDLIEDAARCPETGHHLRLDVARTGSAPTRARVELRCRP